MLLEKFNTHGFDTTRAVHLAVDVQSRYIINAEDEAVARRITSRVAPHFASRAIPTYWFYNKCAGADLHSSVQPSAIDKIFGKDEPSAMTCQPAVQSLQTTRKDWLFVSGFTLAECISDTVLRGIDMGYHVVLLEDGTDYDPCLDDTVHHLVKRGAIVQNSESVFAIV